MICHLYPEPSYLFFSSDVPELLYYAHIPTATIALLAGLFIYFNARGQLQNKLLFLICTSFALWTTINLYLWTGIQSNKLVFVWSFLGVLASLIAILSIYFIHVFIEKRDLSIPIKLVLLLLISPVLLFAHTDLSLSGFDITYCDAFNYEGIIFRAYHGLLGLLAITWIGFRLVKAYQRANGNFKKQILLMGIGIESFLILFFSMIHIASYLATIGVYDDSSLEMYGLFGMMIFVTFIFILTVRFKTFKVQVVAANVLVIALIILISSQFTFITSIHSQVVTAFTLVITSIIGLILIRSVRKEIKQRQEIEELAKNLEKANHRLRQVDKLKSEFVSIASHQLRSPLTSITGYASMLREGNYGELPSKMKEPIERIEDSARLMIGSIEDYLNVSRIESGNMKYQMDDLNLKTEAEHIADDLRPQALKKGLVILFKAKLDSQGVVNADRGKTQQIIHNLLNNALKYTVKGTITVYLHDDIKRRRIYLEIMDTGIGMSTETLNSIFQKFERGDTASSVNISGTGLGLYVALRMAEAMNGSITAYSKGEGEGSRFVLELPLTM